MKKICDECQSLTDDCKKIVNNTFCKQCIYKYNIVRCPSANCNSVISRNGHNNDVDIDDNICSRCNVIVCNYCIFRYNDLIICYDCYSEDANEFNDDVSN